MLETISYVFICVATIIGGICIVMALAWLAFRLFRAALDAFALNCEGVKFMRWFAHNKVKLWLWIKDNMGEGA